MKKTAEKIVYKPKDSGYSGVKLLKTKYLTFSERSYLFNVHEYTDKIDILLIISHFNANDTVVLKRFITHYGTAQGITPGHQGLP